MIEVTQNLFFSANIFMILTFFCLTMSLVSMWIKKTVWIWGVFFGLSIVCAGLAGVVDFRGLIAIGILASFVWLYRYAKG